MSDDLDATLGRLRLGHTRRAWRDLLQRADREQWSHDRLLRTVFAEEVAHRDGKRLSRAVRDAGFPFVRTIDGFDFGHQPSLRRRDLDAMLAPDFVTEGRSVILEGKPGRGKTHLAIAIAYRALQHGFDAKFTTAAELAEVLSRASLAGTMREALAPFVRPSVLVVDDVGHLTDGGDDARALHRVVHERYLRRRSMILTTSKSPKRWGGVLHDGDVAEAVVDRVLERGRLLRLDGPSVRTNLEPENDVAPEPLARADGRMFPGTKAAAGMEPTRITFVL